MKPFSGLHDFNPCKSYQKISSEGAVIPMDFAFEASTEVLGSCSANYMGHMYVFGGSKETKQISVSKRGTRLEQHHL